MSGTRPLLVPFIKKYEKAITAYSWPTNKNSFENTSLVESSIYANSTELGRNIIMYTNIQINNIQEKFKFNVVCYS